MSKNFVGILALIINLECVAVRLTNLRRFEIVAIVEKDESRTYKLSEASFRRLVLKDVARERFFLTRPAETRLQQADCQVKSDMLHQTSKHSNVYY